MLTLCSFCDLNIIIFLLVLIFFFFFYKTLSLHQRVPSVEQVWVRTLWVVLIYSWAAACEAAWLGKCWSWGGFSGPNSSFRGSDDSLGPGQGLITGLLAPGLEQISWKRLTWTSSLRCIFCLGCSKSPNTFLISQVIPSLKQFAVFWKC